MIASCGGNQHKEPMSVLKEFKEFIFEDRTVTDKF